MNVWEFKRNLSGKVRGELVVHDGYHDVHTFSPYFDTEEEVQKWIDTPRQSVEPIKVEETDLILKRLDRIIELLSQGRETYGE